MSVCARRLFAYQDAQSYRIGPNFDLLPVNAPRCPVFNYRQVSCALDWNSLLPKCCPVLAVCLASD